MSATVRIHPSTCPYGLTALRSIALGLLCLAPVALTAAEPYVVKEINQSGAAIAPGAMAGDTFLFSYTGEGGEELWATNGTIAGTRELKDINPGGAPSSPAHFMALGDGRVAFMADDGSTGMEPWISDGTAAGTSRMADVHSGEGGSNPHSFILAGGAVYFVADDGTNGAELWRWDGSQATRVTQLGAGASNGFSPAKEDGTSNLPRGVFGSKAVYFVKNTGGLFPASDKVITADGSGITVIASSMQIPTLRWSEVAPEKHFQQVGNRIVFLGNTGSTTSLYASNGTDNSAIEIKTGGPSGLAVMNGMAYFSCQPGNREYGNANNVRGLWRSDGTTNGTHVVSEAMNPGQSYYGPQSLLAIGSTIYFSARDASTTFHIWTSDGTASGTTKVDQDFAVTRNGETESVSGLTNVGGELWFLAGNRTVGKELWRLQGNTATMFDEILPGDLMLEPAGDKVIPFGGSDRAFMIGRDERERLVLYGAVRGASAVETLAVPEIGPGDPQVMRITKTSDGVIFRADEPSEGERVWFSDGTEAGTIPIYDPKPGIDAQVGTSINTMIGDAVQVDRRLFVFINDGWWPESTPAESPIGSEPFSIDLDSAVKTTELIVDTEPGSTLEGDILKYRQGKGIAAPRGSTVFGSHIYFSASKLDTVGNELFRSNGVDRVEMVADIMPGRASSYPRELTTLAGRLIFHAAGPNTGTELWTYDPGLDQAALIKDINPGAGSVFGSSTQSINFGARRLILAGDYIYFPGDNGTHGTELWRTDGTADGTAMVADINPGGNGLDWSIPRAGWAGALHDAVIFMADDGVHGNEPWIFDGNEARMLVDLNPGSAGSFPDEFVSIGSWCYFAADDGSYGLELWRTNGVVTERLSDGDPGDGDLDPVGLTKVGKSLVFIGHDGADSLHEGKANPELWEYDGVSVRKVWESFPGDIGLGLGNTEVFKAVNPPDEWVAVGNKLFFTVKQDWARGSELWVYETNGQLGGSPGKISLPDGNLTVDEGDDSKETQIFVARIGGEDGPVSARIRSSDGSAVAGTHYEAINTVLTWADGDTSLKSITITTYGDSVFTQDREFTLELSEVTGGATLGVASQRIIISEDDPPPSAGALRFANATIQALEGDAGTTVITVNVTRQDGSDGAISVDYRTADDNASAGSDYVASSGTLTWAAGDSASKSFTVTINGDVEYEADEALALVLDNASGGAAIAQGRSSLIILNDDSARRTITITVAGQRSTIEVVQEAFEVYGGTAVQHAIDGDLDTDAGERLDTGLESDQETTITIVPQGNG